MRINYYNMYFMQINENSIIKKTKEQYRQSNSSASYNSLKLKTFLFFERAIVTSYAIFILNTIQFQHAKDNKLCV
jgi:hypothetical protein